MKETEKFEQKQVGLYDEYNEEYEKRYYEKHFEKLLKLIRLNCFVTLDECIDQLESVNPSFIKKHFKTAQAMVNTEITCGVIYDHEGASALKQLYNIPIKFYFESEYYDAFELEDKESEDSKRYFRNIARGVAKLPWITENDLKALPGVDPHFIAFNLRYAKRLAGRRLVETNFWGDVFKSEPLGNEDNRHFVHNFAHLINLIETNGYTSPKECFGKLGGLSDNWINIYFKYALDMLSGMTIFSNELGISYEKANCKLDNLDEFFEEGEEEYYDEHRYEAYNEDYERENHQEYFNDLLECVRDKGYLEEAFYIDACELEHINPMFIHKNFPVARAILEQEFKYGLTGDRCENMEMNSYFFPPKVDDFMVDLDFDYNDYLEYDSEDCEYSYEEMGNRIEFCYNEFVQAIYNLSWRTQDEWSYYNNIDYIFLCDYIDKARLEAGLKTYKNNFENDVFRLEALRYEDEIHLVHNLANLIALIDENGYTSPEECFGKLGELSDKWIRDNFAGAFGILQGEASLAK